MNCASLLRPNQAQVSSLQVCVIERCITRVQPTRFLFSTRISKPKSKIQYRNDDGTQLFILFSSFQNAKKISSRFFGIHMQCNDVELGKNLVQLHLYPLKIRIFFWSFRHPQADKCPFCSAFFCQLRIIKEGFLAQCMPDKLASRPAISIIYGFL